jgi:hypothetical protein
MLAQKRGDGDRTLELAHTKHNSNKYALELAELNSSSIV